MSNTILACRRICCSRKPKIRPVTTLTKKERSPTKSDDRISNNFLQSNQFIHSNTNIQLTDEIISTPNPVYKIQSNIDLDRLTKEYLDTINEYRSHLGFLSLELSDELTNRALNRATQLSIQNRIENSMPFDLIHNNEPIGETVMSCQTPVNNGSDIAQLIHNELINDIKDGHSPKKRYTPILNSDCHFLGFGLVHNEEKTKDFIVIYYYPIKKSEELWQMNENSITK